MKTIQATQAKKDNFGHQSSDNVVNADFKVVEK